MGKSTGFLEYGRMDNAGQEPLERIKTYREFHTPLDMEERKKQAARCMDCGVPFCQSGKPLIGGMVAGCPLNNLCPEWNDLIYKDNMEGAVKRLLLTNSFPEFTARVCPALCEKSCTCGLHGDPVTVKENEYAIIEYAFENGLIKPQIPAVRTDKKIAVIGSGPAGLAAAQRLNRRGHNVTVFEREDRIGGLLMYGIPNMKLEKNIIDRRVKLMEEEGVVFRTNADVGNNISAGEIKSRFDAVILCCGSSNPRNIQAPGRDANGIYYALDFLKATTKSLTNSNLSDGYYISAKYKNVIVIGGGDTGNDCVGTSDLVLIAAGFLGSESYITNAFGVKTDGRTNVLTDSPEKYQTSEEKIFTAGDMHRGQSLVVWAIREGREAAKAVDEYLMGYSNLR